LARRKDIKLIIINVQDLNSQSIEVELDNLIFYIVLNWNDSGQYWHMSIRNSTYDHLVDGISVSANYPLTWQYRYSDMPPGEIQVLSQYYRNGPVPRDGFSSGKYIMVYQEYAELVALNVMPEYGETSPIVI
jgi:hypothetical protein